MSCKNNPKRFWNLINNLGPKRKSKLSRNLQFPSKVIILIDSVLNLNGLKIFKDYIMVQQMVS